MKKTFFKFWNKQGFTLIELMIVVVIIGILSAIAIPMFLGQRTKAAMTEAETVLRSLALLNEQYYAENGRFAPWPNLGDVTSVGKLEYKGTYGTGSDLEDVFPGFRPGDVGDLNFTYELESYNSGANFQARATGKADTPAAGIKLGLDENNEMFTF